MSFLKKCACMAPRALPLNDYPLDNVPHSSGQTVRQGHRYDGHRLVTSGLEPQTISYSITKYFIFYITHLVRLHFPTTLEHHLVAYYTVVVKIIANGCDTVT